MSSTPALDRLMEKVDSKNPYSKYLHFGEKAKEKTFWSSTRCLIDSWRIEGKMLVVNGHDEHSYTWYGRRNHILGMDGLWTATFPASVCAVEEVESDQWHPDEGTRIFVLWPMWLKDVRCWSNRPKRPTGMTVAEIQNLRECKVPELTLIVKSLGSIRQTRTGNAVMEVFCCDADGERINVTVWDSDIEKFEGVKEGDTITIKNGYAKEYKGVVSVSAGKFGELLVQTFSSSSNSSNSSNVPNTSDESRDYDPRLYRHPRRKGESREDWNQRLKDEMDSDMMQD